MGEQLPADNEYPDDVILEAQAHLRQDMASIREAGHDPADFDPFLTGLSDEIANEAEHTKAFLHRLQREFSFTMTPEIARQQGIDLHAPITILQWLSRRRKELD